MPEMLCLFYYCIIIMIIFFVKENSNMLYLGRVGNTLIWLIYMSGPPGFTINSFKLLVPEVSLIPNPEINNSVIQVNGALL